METRRAVLISAVLIVSGATALSLSALAHRSGCHRWHSCPSDTGSYVCGDLGHSNYCPKAATTTKPKPPPAKPATASPPKKVLSQAATVLAGAARVIDGDTLEIKGQRIRLWGVDAPEIHQTCWLRDREGELPCGVMARQVLEGWIGAASGVTCQSKGKDQHGLVLGVCSLSGGAELNRSMVHYGWALAYRQAGDHYVATEDRARQSGAGIWAYRFSWPWDWRKMMGEAG